MSKEGTNILLGFEDQVDQALRQEASVEIRFLGQLPRFVRKISGLLHLIDSNAPKHITKDHVQKAVQLAEISSAHRRALLQTWRSALAEQEFQQRCKVVLARIVALGPIGGRELCRKFDDLRMGQLAPVLHHLIKTGDLIKRHDGRFDTPERWLSRLRVEIC